MYQEDWKPAAINEAYFRVTKLPRGDETSHQEFKIDRNKNFGTKKKGGWTKNETQEELQEKLLQKEAKVATSKEV